MEFNLSEEELHILKHSLGISYIQWYEREKIDNPYRNYFYTSKNSVDYPIIQKLIKKGLMEDMQRSWSEDASYYYVTNKGIDIAKQSAKESIPKLPKSKKRYQLYLHSEVDESFGDWLKNEYWNDYRKRHGV
jgi:DNA-binding PadR family transcriptional regulator